MRLSLPRLAHDAPLRLRLAAWLGLAAAYGLGAALGLPFSFSDTSATPLWPPSGIALVGLLTLGRAAWPGVWLGAFAANLLFFRLHNWADWTACAGPAAMIACGNAAEALAGSALCMRWLVPRWRGEDGKFSAQRMSVLEFAAVACAASFVGALIGPFVLCAAGIASWAQWPEVWATWFAGDATGILIVAPFLLSFSAVEIMGSAKTDWRKEAAALAALCLIMAASFGEWVRFEGRRVPIAYFVCGPLFWIALRLGPRSMARALMTLAVTTAWYTVARMGLFAYKDQTASLLLLMMYWWAHAISSMALTLEVAARLEAQTYLARLNARLEDMVQHRTEHLRSAFDTIRINERRFAGFMSNLPGIAFMKDLAGRYVYMSDKVGELFGIPHDRWIGRTDAEIWPPATAAQLAATDRTVIEDGRSLAQVEEVPQGDGTHRWLVHKFPIGDDLGRPHLLAGIGIDVTDRMRAEEQLAARMRQQTAVAQLGLRALRGGDPSALLRGAVAQIAATLEVELCGIFEMLADSDALILRAASGWPDGAEGRYAVTMDESTEVGFAALHREALFVPDLPSEIRFRPAPELLAHGAVSGASVVIFGLGERPHGVLCVHSTRKRGFTPDDIAFLQASANVIAMAIHRQSLENEVQESSDNERARIAYDLHDSLGQELAGVSYMASVLASNLARSSSAHAEDAAKVAELLRESVRHTRAIVRGLCPVKIEDGGLPAALTELARSTEEQTGIRCRFEHDESARVDDPFVAGHLFRIAQECVHNAVKHSGARAIAAKLVAGDRKVALIVEDDGVGLDQGRREGGLGLRIMKHRAGIINASLSINSGAAGGTRVTCQTSLN
jgi:PAS domain S-box-containing protein